MSRDYVAALDRELQNLGKIEQEPERLVSTHTISAAVREAVSGILAARAVLPEDSPQFLAATHFVREIRAGIHGATQEWVSTGRAAELTGWSTQTLRKHAQRVIAGEALKDRANLDRGWETVVARQGATGDYELLLSSIPANPNRVEAGARTAA